MNRLWGRLGARLVGTGDWKVPGTRRQECLRYAPADSSFWSLPVPQIGGVAFAAIGALGTPGPEVEAGRVMGAGTPLLVRVAPGVGPEQFDVGAAPFFLLAGGSLEEGF